MKKFKNFKRRHRKISLWHVRTDFLPKTQKPWTMKQKLNVFNYVSVTIFCITKITLIKWKGMLRDRRYLQLQRYSVHSI